MYIDDIRIWATYDFISYCHGYMEISLKTGIEHRLSVSEFKSAVKLQVLWGKLRNFMESSHGILKH